MYKGKWKANLYLNGDPTTFPFRTPPLPSASSPPSRPYATEARGLARLSSVRSHLAPQWPLTSSTAHQLRRLGGRAPPSPTAPPRSAAAASRDGDGVPQEM